MLRSLVGSEMCIRDSLRYEGLGASEAWILFATPVGMSLLALSAMELKQHCTRSFQQGNTRHQVMRTLFDEWKPPADCQLQVGEIVSKLIESFPELRDQRQGVSTAEGDPILTAVVGAIVRHVHGDQVVVRGVNQEEWVAMRREIEALLHAHRTKSEVRASEAIVDNFGVRATNACQNLFSARGEAVRGVLRSAQDCLGQTQIKETHRSVVIQAEALMEERLGTHVQHKDPLCRQDGETPQGYYEFYEGELWDGVHAELDVL
eukprot:TRINITY_DN32339_c0_g1_i1.p1 TRINITY_DN32339_c0_g1~~TRINITY_DN32339_c0_g1_i1.p1  ORF type:complete len:262 (+),score=60.89 TRINITY_DN32339_c0_g1_i1:123-908(+)